MEKNEAELSERDYVNILKLLAKQARETISLQICTIDKLREIMPKISEWFKKGYISMEFFHSGLGVKAAIPREEIEKEETKFLKSIISEISALIRFMAESQFEEDKVVKQIKKFYKSEFHVDLGDNEVKERISIIRSHIDFSKLLDRFLLQSKTYDNVFAEIAHEYTGIEHKGRTHIFPRIVLILRDPSSPVNQRKITKVIFSCTLDDLIMIRDKIDEIIKQYRSISK